MPINPITLERLKDNDATLTTLDISYENLTILDIKELCLHLKENNYLTILNITGNPIGDEGLTLLLENSKLSSLIAANIQIGITTLKTLAQYPYLRQLDISQNLIESKAVIMLAKNNHLEILNIAGHKLSSDVLQAFAENSTLQSLDLTACEFNQLNDLVLLSKNKTLVTLKLNGCQINTNIAKAISDISSLRSLALSHSKIDLLSMRELSKLPLTHLELVDSGISLEEIRILATMTSLKELAIGNNKINDIGLDILSQNHSISKLDVHYNQINDHGMYSFRESTQLEELIVDYNQLTAKTAEILGKLPKLQILKIAHNLLGNSGASQLALSSSIVYLDASGNQIGKEGAQNLTLNKHIKTLFLSSNLLGDDGAIALASNDILEHLYLSYNQIGDAGAFAFANTDQTNLQTLNLNYNQIGPLGREALTNLSTLQYLALSKEQPPKFTEENLNTIFRLSEDFLCIFNLNWNLEFFNPAFPRKLGYQEDELLTQPLFKLLHPADSMDYESKISLNLKFPTNQIHLRCRCKNGYYRWIQWTMKIDNQRIYAVGTDITWQKISDEKIIYSIKENEASKIRIEQTEKFKVEQANFIAFLCHELRNPLSGLSGNLEILKELINELSKSVELLSVKIPNEEKENLVPKFEKINDCLEDMETCTTHQESILNDNLDLSKIAEGKLKLNIVSIPDFSQLIREVVCILKGSAEKKKLSLITQFPKEKLSVKGDLSHIKQILINLVSNAIKFTEKGFVIIELRIEKMLTHHTRLEIIVKDTGIGLEASEMENLFQRFSQANASVGNHYGGSGLGLFIAKSLANLMDGNLTIESQKGVGSTFHCTLQCENLCEFENTLEKKIKPIESLTPYLTHSIWQKSAKPKILIVDDNIINQKMVRKMLEKTPYEYEFANDGIEALEKFKKQFFDLILMDIRMPNMNGTDATKEIRRHEAAKGIHPVPIIAVTGNALSFQRQEALDAGMNDFMSKPYRKQELLETINRFLHSTSVEEKSKPKSPS